MLMAFAVSEGLKNIYIMSNGDKQWLADLKQALYGMGGWDKIATSRDVVLTPEEKYVSHTMDMLIGQRAQVLIGNGVSYLLNCNVNSFIYHRPSCSSPA